MQYFFFTKKKNLLVQASVQVHFKFNSHHYLVHGIRESKSFVDTTEYLARGLFKNIGSLMMTFTSLLWSTLSVSRVSTWLANSLLHFSTADWKDLETQGEGEGRQCPSWCEYPAQWTVRHRIWWCCNCPERDFPQAMPSEQPCQPLENPVHPYTFTWIYILFKIDNFGSISKFSNIDVWRSIIVAKFLEYVSHIIRIFLVLLWNCYLPKIQFYLMIFSLVKKTSSFITIIVSCNWIDHMLVYRPWDLWS